MRLLLINYEYPPVGGGAATATAVLAREFVRLGHTVVILTGSYRDLPALSEEEGILICRIPAMRRRVDQSGLVEMASFLISGLAKGPAVMREHRIEASIAFFSLPSGPIALLGNRRLGIPYIVSLRGGDVPGNEPSLRVIHRTLAPLRRAVLRKSVAIVSNSIGLKKMSQKVDDFPVRVVANGVDCDFFAPATTPIDSAEGRLRVLFVGRLQPQKNLGVILDALATLPHQPLRLTVVGDGPQKEELMEKARQVGISSIVTWRGWRARSEMPGIYQAHDCLLNASLYEGMPNAVLEALASGLPVIASRASGNEDLIAHGENGFLVEAGDAAALASCLAQMCKDDLRRRMGEKARASALRHSWKGAAEQYLEIFSRRLLPK